MKRFLVYILILVFAGTVYSAPIAPGNSPPDGTYIGDIKFGESLPAGTNLMGKVGIDQTTPGTTNGVQVNAALPAGTNLMGKVGIDQTTPGTTNNVFVQKPGTVKEVTFTLDTNIYADGDLLADTQEIATAVRANGYGGIIQSFSCNDKDDQGQPFDVYILQTNVSMGTENNAVAITDANADEIIGRFQVLTSDWQDLGLNRTANVRNIGLVAEADAASTSLYIALVSRGTGTYSASGITCRIGIEQE